mmetsp:Transcript_15847/g.40533  ORF Transcript_15847/g.40533 Transcript_15847/m.40533 type:complete len:695 (+) Transcript_15847:1646-3730(+)
MSATATKLDGSAKMHSESSLSSSAKPSTPGMMKKSSRSNKASVSASGSVSPRSLASSSSGSSHKLNLSGDATRKAEDEALSNPSSPRGPAAPLDPTWCVSALLNGSSLLKCSRAGKPHFRHFQLTEDLTYLFWTSPKKKGMESSVPLESVKELVVGQSTASFKTQKLSSHAHVSFSLLYNKRSLDLVCKDKNEFDIWVTGLRCLLNSSGSTGSLDRNRLSELRVSQQSAKNSSGGTHVSVTVKGKSAKVRTTVEDNDVYTWGEGAGGRLGHGDEAAQVVPKVVQDLLGKDVRTIELGGAHTMAVTYSGDLLTFGEGSSGQLGLGHDRDRFTPAPIDFFAINNIIVDQVVCGLKHTIALSTDGRVFSWGSSSHGQCGHGITEKQDEPKQIVALETVRVKCVAAGPKTSGCVSTEGEVFMWGSNDHRQLGVLLDDEKTQSSLPVSVKSLSLKGVRKLALGLDHSVALCGNGTVYTWGDGSLGCLGHGDDEDQREPKIIEAFGDHPVLDICAGERHNLALTSDGRIHSWGSGTYGQLGHGAAISQYSTPLILKGIPAEMQVSRIACGDNHSAVVTSCSKLYTWGCNVHRELGHDEEVDQFVPNLVRSLEGKSIRNVSCGHAHSAITIAHGWVPDEESDHCMKCSMRFTMIKRRHHCRACGGIYCGGCTSKRFTLVKAGFDHPTRVCDDCYGKLTKKA